MAHYEICCCKSSATMEKFKGIFLKVFTQESNFKSTVANTDRYKRSYKRICATLQDPATETYTSFYAYSISKFEDFVQFQSDEPGILSTCFISPCANLFQICNKSFFVKSCCLVWIPEIFWLYSFQGKQKSFAVC